MASPAQRIEPANQKFIKETAKRIPNDDLEHLINEIYNEYTKHKVSFECAILDAQKAVVEAVDEYERITEPVRNNGHRDEIDDMDTKIFGLKRKTNYAMSNVKKGPQDSAYAREEERKHVLSEVIKTKWEVEEKTEQVEKEIEKAKKGEKEGVQCPMI